MKRRRWGWSGARALAWLLAAGAIWTPTAGAQVLRAPYLQSLTPSSVVVMWQTDFTVGVDSIVHYGTTQGALGSSEIGVASDSPTGAGLRNHAVTLTGLMPGTRYYYDVGTTSAGVDAGGDAEHTFVTAPVPGTVAPFDLWVVGDSGTDSAQQRAVYSAMVAAGGDPELFLHVGDMAYNTGTHAQFTSRVFALYASVLRSTPLYPAVGNHDASEGVSDSTTQSGPYFEAFALPAAGQAGGVASGTEAYYALDYGHAHFIALDSDDSSTSPGSAQLQWLAADLAAVPATQQWIVVWFHHPPYSKGSHDSDLASDSAGRMQRMRENVLPMLEAAGVDLVLAGHSHSYERSYLLAGAYGYGSSPHFATPGLIKLVADGRVLEPGDGRASGDGPYRKAAGRVPFGGTLYVVSGHGGNSLGGPIDHPAMRFSELRHGSLLVRVDATELRVRNVRSDGVVSDDVRLHKPPRGCNLALECTDLRACTTDACSANACQSTPRSCPPGQACSEAAGGCACVPGACDDANACTRDGCDAVTGCTHAAVSCDDANTCTTDSCSPASGCAHAVISCDDNDACTANSCNPATGCAHAVISCDDNNACTADSCDPDTGCEHAVVSCEDANACTADSCDPGTGCEHAVVGCDDADPCTQDSCEPDHGCLRAQICPGDAGAMPDAATVQDASAGMDAAVGMDAPAPIADAGAAAAMDAARDAAADAGGALAPAREGGAAGSSAATGKDASPAMSDGGEGRRDAAITSDAGTRGADAGSVAATPDGSGCRVAGTTPRSPRAYPWLPMLAALLLLARVRTRRTRARCSRGSRS